MLLDPVVQLLVLVVCWFAAYVVQSSARPRIAEGARLALMVFSLVITRGYSSRRAYLLCAVLDQHKRYPGPGQVRLNARPGAVPTGICRRAPRGRDELTGDRQAVGYKRPVAGDLKLCSLL